MPKFLDKCSYCKDGAIQGGEIIYRSAKEITVLIPNLFNSVNSFPQIPIDCLQSGCESCTLNCVFFWHRERSPTEPGHYYVLRPISHCSIMCDARLELHCTVGSLQWAWDKYPVCGHIYFRIFISISPISKNESLTLAQGFHRWKENLVLTFTQSCTRHFGLLDKLS